MNNNCAYTCIAYHHFLVASQLHFSDTYFWQQNKTVAVNFHFMVILAYSDSSIPD